MNKLDPVYIPRHFGLINTGVICYFNSLVQSLMSCSALNKYLMEGGENIVAREYVKLYRCMNSSNVLDYGSAVELWNALRREVLSAGAHDMSRRIFASGGQQCADEALKLMLEALGDDVLSKFIVKYSHYIECEECGKHTVERRDFNSFIKIYGGEIKYTGDDPEMWRRAFQQYLLRHYEIVEDYTCEGCNVKKTRRRYTQLRMLNNMIVIVLEKYGAKKNIYYPSKLVFPAIGGGSMTYQLVSQIDHYGSMFGGHYIARSVRRDGKKICVAHLNDMSVNVIDKDGFIPNTNTYILFYHLG